MFDRERTGTINVNEFGDLFNFINQWKAVFEGIDRDRSGYIEFQELQQGLQDGTHEPERSQRGECRMYWGPPMSMSAVYPILSKTRAQFADMFDKDGSGTIGLNEFQQLFDYINQWKATFQGFDRDASGKIEQAELEKGNKKGIPKSFSAAGLVQRERQKSHTSCSTHRETHLY